MKSITDSPRVLVFDIESSNLKADFGYCLAFGYKELGWKKAKVISIMDFPRHKTDPTNDAPLMRAAHKILTNADIIVSYYGKNFDRKFLNTRMLMAGLDPLPPLSSEHIDLYYTARANLALHSNRLGSVAAMLGCPFKKTEMDGPTWTRAMAGDRASIRYINHHCIMDVEVLEYCYLKLRPYVRQHPAMAFEYRGTCHACGSYKAQRRGFTISKAGGRLKRLQCSDCGQWRNVKP